MVIADSDIVIADSGITSCAKTRPIGLRGLAVVELELAVEPCTGT
jgi:hypothetical protein